MSQRTNIIRMRGSLKNSKPWLCFTAMAANSNLRMSKIGSPDPVHLETSTDGSTWTEYTWDGNTGATITLANIGDKVYWRASSPNARISKGPNDTYRFFSNQNVEVSGLIGTLLSNTGIASFNDYCFAALFKECKITTAPNLTGSAVGERPFIETFQQSLISEILIPNIQNLPTSSAPFIRICKGCMRLERAIIECTNINKYAYLYQAFQGCSSLNSITVRLTSWPTSSTALGDWLDGVAEYGTFICPSALDTSVRDSSHVPVGWTIHKRGYFNSADGIFYNDENFTSPAVVVESLSNDEYYIDIPTGYAYAYNGTSMEKVSLE